MRAYSRANNIMGIINVGSPIADSLAGGILQGTGTSGHRHHLCSQQLHAENIQFLALNIHSSHKYLAFHAKESCHSGGGHTMLTSTSFGDYLLLAHALCQKSLSQSIVNLVGASVKQILPLEINFGSTVVLGELICII